MGESPSEVTLVRTCSALAFVLLTLPVLRAQDSHAGNDVDNDSAIDHALQKIDARDYAEALKILQPLAAQGVARAEFNLGMMYQKGRGVAMDNAAALSWFRKAAAQGMALAQYDIGWMYSNGAGVPQSDAEAVVWYRKAADQGLADAEYSLGLAYTNAVGVKADDKEAAVWLRKAAEQDHAEAQGMLGALYCDGLGLDKDLVEGYKWFALSAAQAVDGARQAIAALEPMLTPAQLAQARNAAAEWRKAHPSQTTVIDLGDPVKREDLPH